MPWNEILSSSIMADNFTGFNWLCCHSLLWLEMNCSTFLTVKISIVKSSIILTDCPLCVDYVGFFVAFNSLSLLCVLRIVRGICHVFAFVYLMFGVLYSSIFKCMAFLSLGKIFSRTCWRFGVRHQLGILIPHLCL